MSETWNITSIRINKDGKFITKAEGVDENGEPTGKLQFESKSLTRLTKMVAPLKPENL